MQKLQRSFAFFLFFILRHPGEIGSTYQRQRVGNVIRGETGILREAAGRDKTDVGLVDTTELQQKEISRGQ